jgi:sugar lactone lactonase YvrE
MFMNAYLARVLGGVLITGGLFVALAGCNGTSSSTVPNNNGGGGSPPPRNSRVYVTDASGGVSSNPNSPDRIDVFTIASLISGTGTGVTPIQEIMSGSFASAYGIAVDSSANVYVTDQGTSSILEFHNNASGTSVAPFRTITSSAMVNPVGIALDAQNNVYVTVPNGGTGSGGGSILEFSSTQSGNVAPIRQISGNATGLNKPYGIALHDGTIYVANNAGNTVEVFAAAAKNNVRPARVIGGAPSGLNLPFGVAVDTGENIYAANFGADTITVYPRGKGSTPIRTITPSTSSGLIQPAGVALDANNNLYVALGGPPGTTSNPTGELVVYPPGANGPANPLTTLAGVGFAAWGVAVF